eukprot:4216185-Prymnesium_polylepis.1
MKQSGNGPGRSTHRRVHAECGVWGGSPDSKFIHTASRRFTGGSHEVHTKFTQRVHGGFTEGSRRVHAAQVHAAFTKVHTGSTYVKV